ncbi:uncharacterized protein MELLADRAFT_71469 [Melampsora larici-populina 98AG31]|uniref:Aquaporin n=1 Tax=Melampsora larici-populina (strain 98AG31 / pathotype 3-4-7) TaxID=747676 RepID=F4RH42_MELLP|nr:uncharacterized protein MELLADRAFT_71469 [Melampsora larici-populina 98AG31]EGG08399.1 hypothetical protein MELLADRAFT_71469 [Melampsora larici-populina 98AG31]
MKTKTQTQLDWPLLDWRPSQIFDDIENDIISASGEFFGTFLFLLVGLGGIQAAATSNQYTLAEAATKNTASAGSSGSVAINTVASIEQLTYISVSMGLSLLFSAWIFYRATGAAFNPNVSLALMLIGVITPTRFVLYAIAQLTGAIVACAVLAGLLPGQLAVTPALGAGTSLGQGLFIECFTTCGLVLSVLFLAVEKHRATFLAPVGIGIALFAGHMFAVIYTGAAMNTARAFGPAVITGFSSDHWVYWLGPSLGSVVAVIVYTIMKRFRYWKLNEGQDTDIGSKSPALFFQPDPERPVKKRSVDLEIEVEEEPKAVTCSHNEKVQSNSSMDRQGKKANQSAPQEASEWV